MPELPEVETLKRELAKVLVGKKIKAFASDKFKLPELAGKKITSVERRAKVLIIKLAGKFTLLVHLKMTGQLIFKPKMGQLVIGGHPQENPFKYTRAVFTFTDGSQLFFNDLRKFGWLRIVRETDLTKIFSETGVEPLSRDFTLEKFKTILARYPHRPLKQLLLDQTLIAGLGNIYVDEACFLAKVLPTRKVSSLAPAEVKKLYESIVMVLKLSIAKKGTSARHYRRADGRRGGFVPYLNVYGRQGQPCKRCLPGGALAKSGGTPITKIKWHGRGTHYCSHCQK
jgi:formamidopyrimidine-DNA glycosylase